jgi:hypothetical protein
MDGGEDFEVAFFGLFQGLYQLKQVIGNGHSGERALPVKATLRPIYKLLCKNNKPATVRP